MTTPPAKARWVISANPPRLTTRIMLSHRCCNRFIISSIGFWIMFLQPSLTYYWPPPWSGAGLDGCGVCNAGGGSVDDDGGMVDGTEAGGVVCSDAGGEVPADRSVNVKCCPPMLASNIRPDRCIVYTSTPCWYFASAPAPSTAAAALRAALTAVLPSLNSLRAFS